MLYFTTSFTTICSEATARLRKAIGKPDSRLQGSNTPGQCCNPATGLRINISARCAITREARTAHGTRVISQTDRRMLHVSKTKVVSMTVAQMFVTPGEICSKIAKSSWVVLSCIFLPISLSTLGPGLRGARLVYGRSTDTEGDRFDALTYGLCNPSRTHHAFALLRLAAQHGQERGFQLQWCERLWQPRSS